MGRILIWQICCRVGSMIAIQSGQLGGNADIFVSIFSADTQYLYSVFRFCYSNICKVRNGNLVCENGP